MSAQDKAHYYLAQLDKELSKYPQLVQLERRTNVPKAYFGLGIVGILFFFIFFNIAAGFISNLLGYVIPAYQSIKALDSPGYHDDQQWLTYWTVFSFLHIIETFSDTLLYWFPFYYTFKCAFVLYLILPQTRGAEVLYDKIIRPTFSQHFSSRRSTVSGGASGATGSARSGAARAGAQADAGVAELKGRVNQAVDGMPTQH